MKLDLEGLEKIGALKELRFINRGIEKESLRISKEGRISDKPHPKGLGSALTNPYITTDFSESLLELITPTFNDAQSCLDFLADVHAFVYDNLEEEILWPCSMPCPIDEEENIPIGNYGQSNSGMMKTIYRRGLSNRYGSMMQAIAGIHYNFSFSDKFFTILLDSEGLKDEQELKNNTYLHIARNFKRFGWLYFLLFGASPVACNSFVGDKKHNLEEHPSGGLYQKDSTSLRMGDLGYISKAQDELNISYNSIEEYCSGLQKALTKSHPPYERLGEFKGDTRIQLNTSVIQIENEYYSTIRPKRVCPSGERPINVLRSEGIEYLELRCVDLDPYCPIGIKRDQIDFMDVFLLFCLVEDSPNIDAEEAEEIKSNHQKIINHGRSENLEITHEGKTVKALDAAQSMLSELLHVASYSGKSLFENKENKWEESMLLQKEKLNSLETTLSGKILSQMADKKQSFRKFGEDLASEHSAYFENYSSKNKELFSQAAQESIKDQDKIESTDEMNFESFLKEFLSKTA